MASITGWTRLEPRPRSDDFAQTLEASVADALWMLARQWQVGELQGDDAGSAVAARLELDLMPVNRYRPGRGGAARPYDVSAVPLESLVEREQVVPDGAVDLRMAAEGGLFFLRMLRDRRQELEDRYRADYITHHPLEPAVQMDTESQRFFAVVGGRAPDGATLSAELRAALSSDPVTLPPNPAIDPADVPDVVDTAREWLGWWDGLHLEPETGDSAWVPERFEYQFAVSAPKGERELVLEAGEYYTGHLDWYAFDLVDDAPLGGAAGPGGPEVVEHTLVPTPVDFAGMPAPRWWELEDGNVDFGRVDAAPHDLARLLLLEFALVYGNDWLMIPVRVGIGSLCQVRSLVVTDTFGEQITVPASAQPAGAGTAWGMFYLAPKGRSLADPTDPRQQYLFVPPTLAASLESPPVEELLVMRDEMANIAWAIERTTQGPAGRPVDRFEAYLQLRTEESADGAAPITGAEVAYSLASTVPDHWIPLVPVRIGTNGRSIALQRGAMLDPVSGEGILPLGRFLTPGQRLIVEDEEVPRVGIRLLRAYQHTRWVDGSSLLWMGRKKTAGGGQSSSELRFDSI